MRQVWIPFFCVALASPTVAVAGSGVTKACTLQRIACGQTINGSLVTSDCSDGTVVVDFYQFKGTSGEPISATLTSSDFPPLLHLDSPSNIVVTDNVAPVGGTATVDFTLDAPGTWTLGVQANSFSFEGGNYTISLYCASKGSCGPNALCLNTGRFKVTATWMNQFDGSSGTAVAIPSTDSTGFFYFTDPSNYELVVKILDIDNVIKVFYTELTDLKFTITVTDTRNGTAKTYQNTPGDCGAIDQNTPFKAAGPARQAAAGHGSCAPSSNTLCLLNKRFAVSVDWMNQFNGASGVGSRRSLSDQSGLFSFTDPTDVELVMKAVDFADRTAFFWGALSNFQYDIAVTDTLGGTTKTYHNPAGSYCGGLDNNAFPP
jgi:hypothetical protein